MSATARGCPVTVGRSAELERVRAALAPGGGVVVSIVGEAGIGKTRLVDDVVRTLDGDVAVRRGACYAADRGLPFGPFLDLTASEPGTARLRDVLRDAAVDADAGDTQAALRRREVFDELTSAVFGDDVPTILVLEDVHWADDVSLRATGHLARRLAGTDHRLLLTHRPDEEPHELESVLAELTRARMIDEVRLAPLGSDEVARMAEEMTGASLDAAQRAALAEVSDGNPFHVEEVVRSTGGELGPGTIVPRPVEHRVLSRLDDLDEESRRAARSAAVLGRDVPLDQLAELMGWDPAATAAHAAQLVDAGLLTDVDGSRLRFVHELARRAVEAQLLHVERVALHREVTAYLTARLSDGEGDAPVDERTGADLARHAYGGGDWDAAVEHGVVAARHARERWSSRAATEHLDRVVDAASRGGITLAPEVIVLRARARRDIGELDEARSDLELAITAADATDDPAASWEARYELALLELQRSHERAGPALEDALRVARSWGDPSAIARTLNRQGNVAANRLEVDEALALLEEAMAAGTDAGDDRAIAETAVLLMVTHGLGGDSASAWEAGVEAIATMRRLGDTVGLVNALFSSSMIGGEHSYIDVACVPVPLSACAAHAEEALRLSQALGWTEGEALSSRGLGSVRSAQGRAAEAVALMRDSLRLAESVGHPTHVMRAHVMTGDVHLDIGDTQGARHHYERALELASQVGAAAASLGARFRMVEVDLAEGRIADAAERLEAALRGAGPQVLRLSSVAAAESALAQGAPDEALRRVDETVRALPPTAQGRPLRLGQIAGRALADLGRLDEADAVLREADLEARELGVRQTLRTIVAARARLAAQAGERELARRLGDEVWTMTAEFSDGLEPELAALLRADTERRTSSVPRAAATPPDAVGGLTPRETEVAIVLARGLTNQQVAEELFISVRTAETHVKRILSKLGLSSRGQVARWVYDHGLIGD